MINGINNNTIKIKELERNRITDSIKNIEPSNENMKKKKAVRTR